MLDTEDLCGFQAYFQQTSNLYRKYLGMVRTALGHQT
jgi:hypothetical protein